MHPPVSDVISSPSASDKTTSDKHASKSVGIILK
jgi:hypothetical protein